jgi:hypothetical protein
VKKRIYEVFHQWFCILTGQGVHTSSAMLKSQNSLLKSWVRGTAKFEVAGCLNAKLGMTINPRKHMARRTVLMP